MDLSSTRYFCEMIGTGKYDEPAVQLLASMEQMLDRLHLERFGHFAGIINAIENHVEEGDGDPIVVRHLGEALLALAALHRLQPRVVNKLTQLLGELHGHIAERAQARGRKTRTFSLSGSTRSIRG